ncbi:MAG: IS481 family transposase [Pseudomonadota bacterium]
MSAPPPQSTALVWARWKYAIIACLFVLPPEKGELWQKIQELAAKLWRHPFRDGVWVKRHASTIERWYYLARDAADPIAALMRKARTDKGRNKVMSTALLLALKAQYLRHPRWTYKLHADNIRVVAEEEPAKYGGAPSEPTVRRRMQERGWIPKSRRRNPTPGQRRAQERLESLEVRSYEVSYVHALWHLDFHEAHWLRVVDAAGQWHTPQALAILDDYSRLGCHMQWYLAETAENLCHGMVQAICKRGRPREQMHDNGGAMLSDEYQNGLRDLSILSAPTLPYSPYQNGKQENFWSRVEERLLAMLEGVEQLTLGFLNRATQAWLELEYNRSIHDEIGTTPLKRMLEGHSVARPAPDMETLQRVFTAERRRTQRRSDGTISIEGVRFELPSRLRSQRKVKVRYRRWDKSVAWVVDARDDTVLARILPQDKAKNADGRRRSLEPLDDLPAPPPPTAADAVAPLMRKLLEEFAATGLPAPYLPKDELLLDDTNEDEENEDA